MSSVARKVYLQKRWQGEAGCITFSSSFYIHAAIKYLQVHICFLHSFSGCDTTSDLSWKGKWASNLQKNSTLLQSDSQFRSDWGLIKTLQIGSDISTTRRSIRSLPQLIPLHRIYWAWYFLNADKSASGCSYHQAGLKCSALRKFCCGKTFFLLILEMPMTTIKTSTSIFVEHVEDLSPSAQGVTEDFSDHKLSKQIIL